MSNSEINRTTVFILALLVGVSFVSSANGAENSKPKSGQYEMVPNPVDARRIPLSPPSNTDICSAYLSNIASQTSNDKYLRCDRPLVNRELGFTRVAWRSINPRKHRDLLTKIARYQSALSYQELDEKKWETTLTKRLKENAIELSISDLDIDNDGDKETVLKYESGLKCDPSVPFSYRYGTKYYVVNIELAEIDTKADISRLTRNHNLFFYKGKVYSDQFHFSQMDPHFTKRLEHKQAVIYIFEATKYGMINKCQYRFIE